MKKNWQLFRKESATRLISGEEESDFASRDYQEHPKQPSGEQIDQRFKDGHISHLQADRDIILARAKQKNIIPLFNNLF